jgi:mRNA interferase MazF
MQSTTAYKQGDVVLVTFPFTDLTSSKQRPAVIVSPDSFNRRGEDIVLSAMTSQITPDPSAVFVARGDVVEGALPKDSQIRPLKLFTLHTSLIVKRLCRLRPEMQAELLGRLRAFFE